MTRVFRTLSIGLGLLAVVLSGSSESEVDRLHIAPYPEIRVQAAQQPPGPYFHQIYRATSSDGIVFKSDGQLVVDHASVPDAVHRPDGEIWLYYINGDPDHNYIFVARQQGDGPWKPIDFVKLNGSFDDYAVDPDIVRLADGRYRLYYYGNFGLPQPRGSIFYSAISSDGINFAVEGEALVVPGGADPTVTQRADGSWLMAFKSGPNVRFATSTDGLQFTLTETTFNNAPGMPELVTLPDGRLRLYLGSDRLLSFISSDGGRSWTQETQTRLESAHTRGAGGPSVIQLPDGQWVLFYIVVNEPGVGPSECQPPASDFTPPKGKAPGPGPLGPWNDRLMSATSTDGLTFTRTNQVITDQGSVPDLVQDSRGCVYLYYVGWTVGTEQNKTVVAISADGGRSWVYKKVHLMGFEGMASPVDPDVQLLPDGTFRLYVTSDPHDGQGPRTYYAEGKDGINFVKKGIAFAQPGKAVLDPSTLLIGSTWHLFAGGNTATPGANWHGTSSDGRLFRFSGETRLVKDGNSQAMSNGIAVPAGGYRFYTFSHGPNPVINSFFTTDGVNWIADPGTRLSLDTSSGLESRGVKDAAVVRLTNGVYLMIYVTRIP